MNIDLHGSHADCPILLACSENDKSLGSILIETRTMSFDDVDDGASFFSTASPFFLTSSPASPCRPTSSSKAKAFVLSCFPRLVRRRAASWFQDVRHTWWPLLSDLSPKIDRLGTLAATVGKNLSQILVLLTFAACIYLFSVNFSSFQHLVIIFLQWIRTLGMLGGVIYVLATALSNLVFIPTTLATLAAGYMFGLWFGFLFAYAGCCLGAVIAFLLGRTLFRSWVSSLARQYPKVALMDQAIGKKAVGWKIVLLLRLSPMLPYNVLNYVLSVTRVPFMDYFLASIAGMFPGVAVFTYFGSLSHDLSSIFSFSAEGMSGADGGHQNLVLYAGFIFSLGAFVLLSYFAANAIKKELKKIEEENEANEKRDRELDLMEKQKQKQKQEDEKAEATRLMASKEPAMISGPAAQLRQIDEALAEVRSGGSSSGSVGVVSIRDDEWPGFEQNRSCGMRKNLSWVDASVA